MRGLFDASKLRNNRQTTSESLYNFNKTLKKVCKKAELYFLHTFLTKFLFFFRTFAGKILIKRNVDRGDTIWRNANHGAAHADARILATHEVRRG